ncbi:lysophospholipid acyltransferase family protein [Thermovibrio sp.]
MLTVSKLLLKTLKVETEFLSPPEFPCIVAFWHGRMFLLPFALREFSDKVAILISRHRDGELIAKIVERLGFKTVRGSTGRGKGGERAFLQMLKLLKKGYCVAITPDGPKGPKEKVKPGVVKLSLTSGVPIYPLTFACSSCFTLNSWDRFKIPKPFSKCKVLLGNPLKPENFSDEEEMRLELERELKSLTEIAQEGL